MPSVVEVLVEAFEKAGTPFITGIPGEESLELMEAARQRGMRFILNKQESAAAMMSATWGEITGSPGICQSTRAPGATPSTMLAVGDEFATDGRFPLLQSGLKQSDVARVYCRHGSTPAAFFCE